MVKWVTLDVNLQTWLSLDSFEIVCSEFQKMSGWLAGFAAGDCCANEIETTVVVTTPRNLSDHHHYCHFHFSSNQSVLMNYDYH